MSTTDELRTAAQAVLDRWDSPQWQWTKHGPTADLMANLRAALDADLNLQVESAITQVQAVHAAFNAGALQQPAASGEPATFDAEGFRAFVLRELPDDTIIGKGQWWADHLTKCVQWFVKPGAQPAPARVPSDQSHPQR